MPLVSTNLSTWRENGMIEVFDGIASRVGKILSFHRVGNVGIGSESDQSEKDNAHHVDLLWFLGKLGGFVEDPKNYFILLYYKTIDQYPYSSTQTTIQSFPYT